MKIETKLQALVLMIHVFNLTLTEHLFSPTKKVLLVENSAGKEEIYTIFAFNEKA